MPPRRTLAPIRARYVGYTKGTENHGDEALFWIIRSLLGPDIDVSSEYRSHELALLGGGTVLNQSPWLIYEFQKQLARAGRGMVFGSGVGDTLFWGNRLDEWRPLLAKCCYIGVRGPQSLALLRENGIENAEACGDPYLAIPPPKVGSPMPGRVAVNFGSTNDSMLGGDEAGFLERMTEVVAGLVRQRRRILWLSVWSRDMEVLSRMRQQVGMDSGPLIDVRKDPAAALRLLATCEMGIGMKLHAVALMAIARLPFIAMEYQPKVRDFTESIGMGDWTLPTSMRDPEELLARLDALHEARVETSEAVAAAVAAARARLQDAARRARAIAHEAAVA